MAPLPTFSSYISSILRRTSSLSAEPIPSFDDGALKARNILPRTTENPYAGIGVVPPSSIPNKFIFVIFGLIGVGFVVTGIWFFFWAKNGGFHFKKDDWDDYKTTVLRRRGPNGTLLSGASESTDLGGGSVVHGEKRSRWGRSSKGSKRGKKSKKDERYKDFDDEESQFTSTVGTSTVGTESEISAFKKKMRRGRKDKKKDKSAMSEVDTVVGEHSDVDASVADAIREYRHEKPARVGGINKQPEGISWDGSNEAASELLSHREKTPTNTPTKVKKERKDNYTGGNGGIRKVVSTSQPSGDIGVRTRESTYSPAHNSISEDRIKAEARKLQEKGRAATGTSRRDFSFQHGDDNSTVTGSSSAASEAAARRERREERERRRQSRSPTKKMPGSYHEVPASEAGTDMSSELGTKSYHHVIPGLSSTAGSDYAEDRRRKRNGGYRRGRQDSDGE